MEAINAGSDFKKFGSEGVKWLWEKEVGLGEACDLPVCFGMSLE